MLTGFPREARLVDSQAFKRVFAEHRRYGSLGYTLLVRTNGRGFPRLGLAIAKKCAPRAVDRNRLKRLVRESFRVNATTLPAVDIVVLCVRGAPLIPNERLRAGLDLAWKQLGNRSWAGSSSD